MSTAFTGVNITPKVSCYESYSADACAAAIAGAVLDFILVLYLQRFNTV